MAREPVTRLQLDAYRFGQRRLESALARRDPVLLHEEIRGQRRVVLTGLVLAVLVLLGSFGYARLANKPAWERQTIIAAKQSGRMYVVIHRPDRLVPVRNVVAARLVLAAAAGVGRVPAGGEVAVIDDAVLDRAPRTAAVAVPGADGVRLPDGADLPALGDWAVCDVADGPRTVVVAGAAPAVPMAADQGLLLASGDRDLYLVTGGRRYRLDSVTDLQRAYDLVDVKPRTVSAALLEAIPEGPALRTPRIPDAGEAAPGGLPARVGDIVRVTGAGGERFYLVLAGGVREVARPVANLIRGRSGSDRSRPPALVDAELLNTLDRPTLPGLEDFPTDLPRVPSGPEARTVCWRWNQDGRGGQLVVGRDAPIPPDQQRTQLAQADGAGPKLDMVSVPTGRPLVLRTATGGVWLVSDTGVGYRVAGGAGPGGAGPGGVVPGGVVPGGVGAANETATALGIRPDVGDVAPEQLLRLLPTGPDVDLQSATRTVDVLVGPGPS